MCMFAVTTTGQGQCMAFPDTCMTPGVSAGAPGPLPYPNIGMLSDGSGSKKFKMLGKVVIRKGDELSQSSGDEAGNSPGGVVSSKFKGKCEIMVGYPTVKVEGKEVGMQFSVVGQNKGATANMPAGVAITVMQ